MNKKDRFFATIARQPVDRNASWLGLPTPAAMPGLMAFFGVDNVLSLKQKLDDDVYPIEMPYHAPGSNAIYTALNFARSGRHETDFERTLTAPGFFEDAEDPSEVSRFPWPDPAGHIPVAECQAQLKEVPEDYAVLGVIWSAHFQDTCAAFGMETALINMLANPNLYRAVDDQIVNFYLKANEIFFEATKGRLDAILIGNDMGSQRGLIISPEQVREFVLPGSRKLIQQAKSYGLKVIYHSCGSIEPIIPDLIESGVDVIHPIQALAADMELAGLKAKYSQIATFCGGVDAQELLVNGHPQQVFAKVIEIRKLLPTGLIVSPSHEAILPDIPPANIEALFAAAHADL
jgi:uroporphyrinogen decarboxylase